MHEVGECVDIPVFDMLGNKSKDYYFHVSVTSSVYFKHDHWSLCIHLYEPIHSGWDNTGKWHDPRLVYQRNYTRKRDAKIGFERLAKNPFWYNVVMEDMGDVLNFVPVVGKFYSKS